MPSGRSDDGGLPCSLQARAARRPRDLHEQTRHRIFTYWLLPLRCRAQPNGTPASISVATTTTRCAAMQLASGRSALRTLSLGRAHARRAAASGVCGFASRASAAGEQPADAAPSITVVTPCTGHRDLGRCLRSVQRQSGLSSAQLRHLVFIDGERPGVDAAWLRAHATTARPGRRSPAPARHLHTRMRATAVQSHAHAPRLLDRSSRCCRCSCRTRRGSTGGWGTVSTARRAS